jgi:non-ribosomal peptide synthetase component F
MLTAFAALLSHRTGQRDVLVGTPVANRTDSATAEMIGLFVNTLPVRCDLSGQPTFTELAERLSRTVIAGLGHAELPFERIVDLLDVARDPATSPLVQVMFALQRGAAAAGPSRHGQARPHPVAVRRRRHDERVRRVPHRPLQPRVRRRVRRRLCAAARPPAR